MRRGAWLRKTMMSISYDEVGLLAPWVRSTVTPEDVTLVAGASSYRIAGEPSRILLGMLTHLSEVAPLALALATIPPESRDVGEGLLRYLDSEHLILRGAAAAAYGAGHLAAFELQKRPGLAVAKATEQIAWITDSPEAMPSIELLAEHRLEPVICSTNDAMDLAAHDLSHIIVADDVQHDWRVKWNMYALEHELSWTTFEHWNGSVATVGPVFVPHAGPCFECLVRRRQASAGIGTAYEHVVRATSRRVKEPAIDAIVASLLARYLWRWVRLGDDAVIGEQWLVSEVSAVPTIDTGRVLRVPRCDACSMAGSYQRRTAWRSPVPVEGLA